MTEDRDRAGFFTAWVDSIFTEIPEGGERRADDRELPQTRGLTAVQPHIDIAVAPTVRTGVWE